MIKLKSRRVNNNKVSDLRSVSLSPDPLFHQMEEMELKDGEECANVEIFGSFSPLLNCKLLKKGV